MVAALWNLDLISNLGSTKKIMAYIKETLMDLEII